MPVLFFADIIEAIFPRRFFKADTYICGFCQNIGRIFRKERLTEMAYRKFVLPGPETISMSAQEAQKLFECGNGDAALLYLYILRNRGNLSTAEASYNLRWAPAKVRQALKTLAELGLVKKEETLAEPEEAAPVKEELPEYTAAEIQNELRQGAAFQSLVAEVQRSLGKILSSDDLMKLFGIYDSLGLPPEVILLLVTHCLDEFRRRYGPSRTPTMRYIEKNAYIWEREGVFSLELAEEYLKRLAYKKGKAQEIKAALQIKDRELTASEQRYIDAWIDWGFPAEAVEIAYDRTVLKTGKLAWAYLNSILKSWHAKNLHTALEIQRGDGPAPAKAGGKAPGGFSAPSAADMERMKKMLEKYKQDER